jgi:hypothetical protein
MAADDRWLFRVRHFHGDFKWARTPFAGVSCGHGGQKRAQPTCFWAAVRDKGRSPVLYYIGRTHNSHGRLTELMAQRRGRER